MGMAEAKAKETDYLMLASMNGMLAHMSPGGGDMLIEETNLTTSAAEVSLTNFEASGLVLVADVDFQFGVNTGSVAVYDYVVPANTIFCLFRKVNKLYAKGSAVGNLLVMGVEAQAGS